MYRVIEGVESLEGEVHSGNLRYDNIPFLQNMNKRVRAVDNRYHHNMDRNNMKSMRMAEKHNSLDKWNIPLRKYVERRMNW